MTTSSKHVACPGCRFPNLPGSLVCLTCKAPLPGAHDDDPATERLLMPRGLPGVRPPAPERVPDQLTDTLRRRTVAWLVCDPFDPVPLGAVPTLSIGRGRECGLVLPHTGVSREHAIVRVLGRTILIEDRSTFGTFINGQRVSTRELQAGDRIAIGPYELRVVAAQGGQDSGEGTRQMKVPLVDPEATAMAGSLERVPALEVLQGFEFHAKTGTFHVITPDGVEGVLTIIEGRPVHARMGDLVDDEAVLALALLRAGQFRVLAAAEPGPQTIRGSLTELLLEANRRLDERER
ncbi:MAG: FHA domain-containing protein [Planctomycetes bacterium]|nr:FHA domain-containing protein [Planctomycetota bacterium]